jgi:hypothetical protein
LCFWRQTHIRDRSGDDDVSGIEASFKLKIAMNLHWIRRCGVRRRERSGRGPNRSHHTDRGT